ncbi:MAG: HEAT repeat domain-containing protein [Thermoanaerobaculia bacterium]
MPASPCPFCGTQFASGNCPTCAASARGARASGVSLPRLALAAILIGAAVWFFRVGRSPAMPSPASWFRPRVAPTFALEPTAVPIPETASVEELIAVLYTDDDERRGMAAARLAKSPDKRAVPALLFTLEDRTRAIRGVNADTPGMVNGEPVNAYAGFLALQRHRVRARAAEALGQALSRSDAPGGDVGSADRESCIDALIRAVKDRDEAVRRTSITALGEIHDPSSLSTLIGVLKTGDDYGRPLAADALGNFTDPLRIPALIAALDDKESAWHASYALAASNDPSAAQALWSALRRRRFAAVSGAGDLFVKQCARADEPILMALLTETNELSLAQSFEKSSNPRLQAAARAWSARVK